MDKLIDLIKALTPIIAVLFATGGVVIAYIKYLDTRPGKLAKARQSNITGELEINKATMAFVDSLQKRLDAMDKKLEAREEEYQKTIKEKDATIATLQGEVNTLKGRVDSLQKELNTKI